MRFLAIGLLVFLSGCATGYQKENFFSGGFSETQLGTNIFRVSFKGNGYTSTDRAEEMVLLRSADIALSNGFSHFIIVNSANSTNYSVNTTPLQSYGNGVTSGGQVHVISKPSTNNTIICYNEKPSGFSYEAKFVFNSLAKKYGAAEK